MDAQSSVDANLLRQIRSFAPAQAPALFRLTLGILGVETASPRDRDEVIRLCRALASEGSLVQEMAGEIAHELLRQ